MPKGPVANDPLETKSVITPVAKTQLVPGSATLDAVLALQHRLVRPLDEASPEAGFLVCAFTPSEAEAIFAEPATQLFTASVGGELVGYALLVHSDHLARLSSTPAHWANPDAAYFHQLGVEPRHAGRGIGRALIEAAQAANERVLVDVICLPVNNLRSRRLFQSCGFVPRDVLLVPSFRDLGPVESVVMSWSR